MQKHIRLRYHARRLEVSDMDLFLYSWLQITAYQALEYMSGHARLVWALTATSVNIRETWVFRNRGHLLNWLSEDLLTGVVTRCYQELDASMNYRISCQSWWQNSFCATTCTNIHARTAALIWTSSAPRLVASLKRWAKGNPSLKLAH